MNMSVMSVILLSSYVSDWSAVVTAQISSEDGTPEDLDTVRKDSEWIIRSAFCCRLLLPKAVRRWEYRREEVRNIQGLDLFT